MQVKRHDLVLRTAKWANIYRRSFWSTSSWESCILARAIAQVWHCCYSKNKVDGCYIYTRPAYSVGLVLIEPVNRFRFSMNLINGTGTEYSILGSSINRSVPDPIYREPENCLSTPKLYLVCYM